MLPLPKLTGVAKRRWRVSALLLILVVSTQVVLWLVSARAKLEGQAWVALVMATLEDSEELTSTDQCVAVEPELYAQTPLKDRETISSFLEGRKIKLLTAEPTHNPPTGFRERKCVEVFRAPEGRDGYNLPIISQANVAYYTYDFNGDAVLMFQLGTRWAYVTHWNEWF